MKTQLLLVQNANICKDTKYSPIGKLFQMAVITPTIPATAFAAPIIGTGQERPKDICCYISIKVPTIIIAMSQYKLKNWKQETQDMCPQEVEGSPAMLENIFGQFLWYTKLYDFDHSCNFGKCLCLIQAVCVCSLYLSFKIPKVGGCLYKLSSITHLWLLCICWPQKSFTSSNIPVSFKI